MEALVENQNEIIEKEEKEEKEENEENEESEENKEIINDKDSSCFERLCKLQKLIKEESSLGKMCK